MNEGLVSGHMRENQTLNCGRRSGLKEGPPEASEGLTP